MEHWHKRIALALTLFATMTTTTLFGQQAAYYPYAQTNPCCQQQPCCPQEQYYQQYPCCQQPQCYEQAPCCEQYPCCEQQCCPPPPPNLEQYPCCEQSFPCYPQPSCCPCDPCCSPCCDPCNQCCEPTSWCVPCEREKSDDKKENLSDPCSCAAIMGLDFGVDFIMWLPCIDDLDFAAYQQEETVIDTVTVNGHKIRYKDICNRWQPGVRVGFVRNSVFNNWGMMGTYTWIRNRDKRSVDTSSSADTHIVSPLLHGAFGDLRQEYQIASGRWSSKYQTGDFLFSYGVNYDETHALSPFFGISALFLNLKLKSDYYTELNQVNDSAFFEWESDYWGVGLKGGTEYSYNVMDCFRIFGRASATIVAGQAFSEQKQGIYHENATELTRRSFRDDSTCLLIPGYHFQVGIFQDCEYCDMGFGIKVGYEFLRWHNVPNHRSFAGADDVDVAISTSPNTRTLGYHGFFAGIGVGF